MLKSLNKILCSIALVFTLIIPTACVSEVMALESITPEQMKLIQKDVKVNDLDIDPLNTSGVKKDVVPDTKKEGKKVFAYFLRTMLAVAFSAIVIYLALVLVKKYYGSDFVSEEEKEEQSEAFDLSTPNSKQDALKSFLDRTK